MSRLTLAILCSFFLCCSTIAPALATRLPAELARAVSTSISGAHVRLDGAVEVSADLYLPLVPPPKAGGGKTSTAPVAPPAKPTSIALEGAYPNVTSPVLLSFTNGWCFLKVQKKGDANTVVIPEGVPEKLRKHVATCRLPSDLIVPDRLVWPKSMKAMLGDVNIPLVEDVTGKVGQAAKKTIKPADSVGGWIFVSSPQAGFIVLLDDRFKKVAEFPTEGTPAGMTYAAGRLYIADQGKGRILMLDPKKRQFLGQIDLPKGSAPKGITATPSGKLLYVSESGTNTIAVVETDTDKVLLRTRVSAGPARLALTPDGSYLIVCCVPGGLVTLISTLNQKVIGTVQVGTLPTDILVSKDSQTVYVSNRMSNTVSAIDIHKRAVVHKFETGTGPTGLAFSQDGSKLFVAYAKDNTLGIYDLATKQKINDVKLPLDVDFPSDIAVLPDGVRFVLSSAATDAIGIFDSNKMTFEQQPIIGHTSSELLWIPNE